VCVCTCVHAHTCVHVHTRVCMYTCTCIRISPVGCNGIGHRRAEVRGLLPKAQKGSSAGAHRGLGCGCRFGENALPNRKQICAMMFFSFFPKILAMLTSAASKHTRTYELMLRCISRTLCRIWFEALVTDQIFCTILSAF